MINTPPSDRRHLDQSPASASQSALSRPFHHRCILRSLTSCTKTSKIATPTIATMLATQGHHVTATTPSRAAIQC
jgi:hypothetical protein